MFPGGSPMPSLVAIVKQPGVFRPEFLRLLLVIGFLAFQGGSLDGQLVGFLRVLALFFEQTQLCMEIARAGLPGLLGEFRCAFGKPFGLCGKTAVLAAQPPTFKLVKRLLHVVDRFP